MHGGFVTTAMAQHASRCNTNAHVMTSHVDVSHIEIAADRHTDTDTATLELSYTLRAPLSARESMTMVHPDALTIDNVTCAAAKLARRRSEGEPVLYFTLQRGASFDAAMKWTLDEIGRARLVRGS